MIGNKPIKMKACIFVLSYPNTEKKLRILERSIFSLKNSGLPVISVSNIFTSEKITGIVDDFIVGENEDCRYQDFFTNEELDEARNSSRYLSHYFPSKTEVISYAPFSYGRGSTYHWSAISQFLRIVEYSKENGFTHFLIIEGDSILTPGDISSIGDYFLQMKRENLDFIISLQPHMGHICANAWFTEFNFWEKTCLSMGKEDFMKSTYPSFSSELYLTNRMKKIGGRGNVLAWDPDFYSGNDFPEGWNLMKKTPPESKIRLKSINLFFPETIEIELSSSKDEIKQNTSDPFSYVSMGTGVREGEPIFFILNEYSQENVEKIEVKVCIFNENIQIFQSDYILESGHWAWGKIPDLELNSYCTVGISVIDKSGNSSYFEDRFGSVGVNLVLGDYEMQREIMISVLVVNLNNLQFTKDCIQDLFDQDVSCLITLVDQASVEEGTKEYLDEIGIKGVTVIRNPANEPLNHIWNWFAKTSETHYVCLLNNDVRLSPNFLSSAIEVFEREPQVGFVNHATNSKEYSSWSKELKYSVMEDPYRQGWDPIFRKECYSEIPQDLHFFFGDDFIYSKLYESGMKGAYVLNSPILHFERSTTEEKGGLRDCSLDGEYFHGLDLSIKEMSFSYEYCRWKPEFSKITGPTKYYKEDYISFNPDVNMWENHLNYKILSQYSEIIIGKVADFGCNHGACTILAARNEKVQSIKGLDINSKAIKIANDVLSISGEDHVIKQKVKFSVGDLTNLNRFKDDEFDSAFCFHTLEHIFPSDYDFVFSEWKRVIKNGGNFIVSVPYLRAYDDPSHVNYFDETSLSDLFSKYGFKVNECYRDQRDGFDCLNIVVQIVKQKIDLSIIICSLLERRNEFLDRLLNTLEPQIEGKQNVEILVLNDNAKRSIGRKRNDGLAIAQGKYVCFIDDDDMVTDDYVDQILNEIRKWEPDVIVFDAIISFDGTNNKLVKYGREFDHTEKQDAYYRRPNHLMVHKRSNITEFFMDVKTGEDDEWASRMLDRIVTQSRINKPLYFYDYRTTTKKYFE
jgi:SAM-dependent methyltransferase